MEPSEIFTDIDPADGEPFNQYLGWDSPLGNLSIHTISSMFYKASPIRIWTQESSSNSSVGEVFTDYRHTFHTTQQDVTNNTHENTWRAYYKFLDSIDYVNQNTITTYMFPYWESVYESGGTDAEYSKAILGYSKM